jgi:hypothetical protein
MAFIPRDATNEQVLDIILEWIDVLANEEYEIVYATLGYLRCHEPRNAEIIRWEIKQYRSPELYPNIEEFTVTDWRTANGGNIDPVREVMWYKPNDTRLRGAVAFDLPLNGQWSDLQADFVFFDNENVDEGYILCLEEIGSFMQRHREIEEMDAETTEFTADLLQSVREMKADTRAKPKFK